MPIFHIFFKIHFIFRSIVLLFVCMVLLGPDGPAIHCPYTHVTAVVDSLYCACMLHDVMVRLHLQAHSNGARRKRHVERRAAEADQLSARQLRFDNVAYWLPCMLICASHATRHQGRMHVISLILSTNEQRGRCSESCFAVL